MNSWCPNVYVRRDIECLAYGRNVNVAILLYCCKDLREDVRGGQPYMDMEEWE